MKDLILRIIKIKEKIDKCNILVNGHTCSSEIELSKEDIDFLYKKLDINPLLTYQEAKLILERQK